MQTVKFAALAGAAVLLSPLAVAANNEPLEETVVTATRTPEPVDALAASVIVITRDDIERSLALDIGSLLAQHAGLEVARNGGPGQAASLFVRGTNSDHTLVMVDGVRINPGTIGGAAIHNIAPDTVERVEIVKGPRSSLWGSDAIGGVVNIFTRAATAQGIGLSLAGGRYGNRSVQLDGGLRFADRGSVGFAFGQIDSDGFPPLLTSNEDRGFRNRSVNLAGQLRATDQVTLNAHAWRAQGTSDYLDFFATPVSQDFRNQALGVDADIRTDGRGRYRVALLQMDDEIRQVDVEDFVSTRRSSVDLQGNWQLAKNLELTAGTVLSREDTESLSFGSGFDERSNIRQAYAQGQYQRGAQRVTLAAGVLDHPAFGSHTTWNADYALRLGRGFTITAAAGTAFKAPDATDRFGFGANPSLRPEKSRQVELGLRQQLGARQSWQLVAYRNNVEDLINYVVTDFVTFDGRNENIDRARIEGVELSYRVGGESWRLELAAALNDPRDLGTGQVLLRRARQVFSASATRRFGRFELNADVQSVGTRFDFGFPAAVRLAPYTLANVGASFAVSADWKLQLRLDNALDESYELASNYRTPGRSLMLATRYRFR